MFITTQVFDVTAIAISVSSSYFRDAIRFCNCCNIDVFSFQTGKLIKQQIQAITYMKSINEAGTVIHTPCIRMRAGSGSNICRINEVNQIFTSFITCNRNPSIMDTMIRSSITQSSTDRTFNTDRIVFCSNTVNRNQILRFDIT